MSVWPPSVLIFALALLVQGAYSVPESEDEDIAKIFDPNDKDAGYQRRYTTIVPPKTEDCYFLENVLETQVINFHFMVLNVGKNGRKLDITARIRGPDKKVVNFQSRKNEGRIIGQEIKSQGDYEICFNNRYSLLESKRVFWQFEVEGAVDEVKEEQKSIEENLNEYKLSSAATKKYLSRVRTKVSRMRHNQWRIESLMRKDTARAESIRDMIDQWSLIHATFLVIIGVVQVVLVRRLFAQKSSPHYIHMRT